MTTLETQKHDDPIEKLFDEAVSIEEQARRLDQLGYDIDWREVKLLEEHAFLMRKHYNRRQRRLTGWWHRDQAEFHTEQVRLYIDKFHQQRGAQMAA